MSNHETNADGHRTKPRYSGRRRFLKTGVGVAATALAVPTLGGTAIAHFPRTLEIDVKPESGANAIDPSSDGVVPVAVLHTDEFDPTDEAVRYRFGSPDAVADGGGARPIHEGHVEDLDGDGCEDLVLHFPLRNAGFEGDESEAELRWEKDESGEHGFSGRDTVKIVERGREREGGHESTSADGSERRDDGGNGRSGETGC